MTAAQLRRSDADPETEVDAESHALAAAETRADQLAAAVLSNRRIGIAIGLVMTQKGCSETESFETLRRVSMDTNRRLADVAEDVIGLRRLAPAPRPRRRR